MESRLRKKNVNAPIITIIRVIDGDQIPIPNIVQVIIPSVVENDDIPVQLLIQLETLPFRVKEPL